MEAQQEELAMEIVDAMVDLAEAQIEASEELELEPEVEGNASDSQSEVSSESSWSSLASLDSEGNRIYEDDELELLASELENGGYDMMRDLAVTRYPKSHGWVRQTMG